MPCIPEKKVFWGLGNGGEGGGEGGEGGACPDTNLATHTSGAWWAPEALISKLPVIPAPVNLFCFPSQMGVSKVLKIMQ